MFESIDRRMSRVSSNTSGLTLGQFLAMARRLAEERGAVETLVCPDGTVRRIIPRAILCELRDTLHFGPPCEVNPFAADICRLPRGYRFACGYEAFADFANLNTCIAPPTAGVSDPVQLAA